MSLGLPSRSEVLARKARLYGVVRPSFEGFERMRQKAVADNIERRQAEAQRLVHEHMQVGKKRLDDAVAWLADMERQPPTAREIIAAIAIKHELSVKDITGPRRNSKLVAARHEAMYLVHEHTSLSFPQIGKLFGGRDHTSVLIAVRHYTARLEGRPIIAFVYGRDLEIVAARVARYRRVRELIAGTTEAPPKYGRLYAERFPEQVEGQG